MKSLKERVCKIACYLELAVIAAIYLFVFSPVVDHMYGFLEVKPDIRKADAIILLGSTVYAEDIFARDTYQRLFRAFNLYKEGYADKIIVSAGPMNKDEEPVAELMKKTLVKIGVKGKDIFIETTSRDTHESIRNIAPLLKELGIKNSLLVTSSFHMYRSLAIARKLGINVYPAPVACYEKNVRHIIHISEQALIMLREYGAIAYFKLRGWI